jgi:hypothetical protein
VSDARCYVTRTAEAFNPASAPRPGGRFEARRGVVTYARASTQKQGRSGLGLEGQESPVMGFIQAGGQTGIGQDPSLHKFKSCIA